jgi:hypothetical protein
MAEYEVRWKTALGKVGTWPAASFDDGVQRCRLAAKRGACAQLVHVPTQRILAQAKFYEPGDGPSLVYSHKAQRPFICRMCGQPGVGDRNTRLHPGECQRQWTRQREAANRQRRRLAKQKKGESSSGKA